MHLVGYLYNCIRDARSQKHPICQSVIFWHYYELTLFSTLVGQGLNSPTQTFSRTATEFIFVCFVRCNIAGRWIRREGLNFMAT